MFPPIVGKWLAVILVLVSAITLTGCNPTEFKTAAAQVSELVVSVLNDPQTFNFALNQQSPSIFGLTFKGLTSVNGVTGEIQPELAESWQISDDKLRIVFTLRDNLKWSDGVPLTADDVVFTYEQIVFNKEIPTDIRDYVTIGTSGAFPKVRKLDDRRVEFILPEPFAPFLVATTGSTANAVAILPKHALQESVSSKNSDGNPKFLSTWGTDTDPTKIIVSGPYKLESYIPSQRLVFRRNPYYWRKDAQDNPQPYIERYIWQIVESPDTSLMQFRSGGLDMIAVSAANFSLLKHEEKRGDFKIYNGGPAIGTTFISFNLNKGKRDGRPLIDPIKSRWFNTVAFRQAVAHAIDRQTIINTLLRGLGEPQHSTIDIQTPYYYLSPKNGLKVYDYNPEKARELLLRAGFKYNNKGQLLDTDGNHVRFTMLSSAGSRLSDAVGTQMQQDLGKIGIKIDLNPIAFSVLGEKLHNSLDWECYFGAMSGGGIEPNDAANVWLVDGGLHTFNQAPQPGQTPIEGRELANWEREIANLYIKGAQELDQAKRKAIYDEAQQLAQEYLPFIHMINPLSMAAIRNSVQGVKYSVFEGPLWNIYELKVVNK